MRSLRGGTAGATGAGASASVLLGLRDESRFSGFGGIRGTIRGVVFSDEEESSRWRGEDLVRLSLRLGEEMSSEVSTVFVVEAVMVDLGEVRAALDEDEG